MPITLKQFQQEDLAAAAMHDSAIISWEQGLGKTIAAFAWPLLKNSQRTLIVAPGGLHKQIQGEGLRFFGVTCSVIHNAADFHSYNLDKPVRRASIKPKFFLISYETLGMSGGDEWAPPLDAEGDKTMGHREEKRLKDARQRFSEAFYRHCLHGVGTHKQGIQCLYAPTIATLIRTHDSFDCIVLDEATRIQSTEGLIANSLRRLRPRYRLLLSGTPIKNTLYSIFWLLQWACGNQDGQTNPRFPYTDDRDEPERFASAHLEIDRFLTREEDRSKTSTSKSKSQIRKRSPRICNIHHLWKLLGPCVVRRRKTDIGEDIAPKTIKPIRVEMSGEQRKVYGTFLRHSPHTPSKDPRVAVCQQLGLLRQAALSPDSPNLKTVRLVGSANKEKQFTKSPWTPKLAATLTVIAECLERGEQVLIGSPFTHFSKTLFKLLNEAGLPALLLDGGTNPKERGRLARDFKSGHYRILIGGLKSMGEGHSFSNCPNLILPSLSWAFDENDQFLHRVWRLDSGSPVTIYPIITEMTIDERLENLYHDKGGAASLALDGRLFSDPIEEVDPAALLAQAYTLFNAKNRLSPTSKNSPPPNISEENLIRTWPLLKARLQNALAQIAA